MEGALEAHPRRRDVEQMNGEGFKKKRKPTCADTKQIIGEGFERPPAESRRGADHPLSQYSFIQPLGGERQVFDPMNHTEPSSTDGTSPFMVNCRHGLVQHQS